MQSGFVGQLLSLLGIQESEYGQPNQVGIQTISKVHVQIRHVPEKDEKTNQEFYK
jgi:hypothetical protein